MSFDTHGSVHRRLLSRSTNKMQLCNRIYYSKVYWSLNMFRAAHRSSSGALNSICSLWFICSCGHRPVTTWAYKPEAANTVYSSWWWAVRRSKHVEPSINFGIINSITKLHLVGISTEWFMSYLYIAVLSFTVFLRHEHTVLWTFTSRRNICIVYAYARYCLRCYETRCVVKVLICLSWQRRSLPFYIHNLYTHTICKIEHYVVT